MGIELAGLISWQSGHERGYRRIGAANTPATSRDTATAVTTPTSLTRIAHAVGLMSISLLLSSVRSRAAPPT
jgi:hypothetical protein